MMRRTEDYTIDELMITTLSRQLHDYEVVAHGVASIIPYCACRLARLTHAPNLTHLSLLGANPEPKRIYPSTYNPSMSEDSVWYMSLPKLFDYAQRGRIDTMFFRSGVQIDRKGDINLSLLGSYKSPRVRFAGGAGTAVLCHTVNRVLMWLAKHTTKAFVKDVDFVTISGHLPEVKRRFDKIVTNLGVVGFDKRSGLMKVVSIHPGVSTEELVRNTGFELEIPNSVSETSPPTEKEVNLIRNEIDIHGDRKIEFQ